MQLVDVFTQAFSQLITELVTLVPQILVALLIWWLGNRLIDFGAMLLRRIDLPNTKLDDKAINVVLKVVIPIFKGLLVLVVLDYLGIGRSIISAIATGFTLTVAIALGLSFGKALEPEAKIVVREVKKLLNLK